MTQALMPEWLRHRARTCPSKAALVEDGRILTFHEADTAAGALAARLRSFGVRAGDRVALLAPNGIDFVLAVYGAMRAGAVLVPLNTRLTANELAAQLADCEPALVVTGVGPVPAAVRQAPLSELVAGPYDKAVAGGSFDPGSLHSIIYTSGTTGSPKGAMLSYGNFLWNAFGSAANLGMRENDRWLACMPLFHVGGLSIVLRGLVYGMTVEIHDGFDPSRVNAALSGGKVTIVSLVATMLRRMLDATGGGFAPELRCVLLGGGPVPPDLLQECSRRGVPVATTYGLTEAASQVATLLPPEAETRPGSAGQPLLTVDMRIVSEGGEECPPGEPGEIVLRGPTVIMGYWRRPDDTAAALRDGWFHTGDQGYLDADGYLYVLDRRDDLVVSGGENVYPAEVEAALLSHPDVADAAVFGVADATWGQRVEAAVILRQGAAASAEDLAAHCRGRLAGYKVPRRLHFLSELPRNAAGKLLRYRLRQAFS